MMKSNGRMSMCTKCYSRQSQVTCDDCSEKFCNQCYNDHQRDLAEKYQQLCCQIDAVKELLDSVNSRNAPNTSHELITKWEQRMYQEVSNTASKLHYQLDERTRNVTDHISSNVNQITSELNSMRKIETYIERDISRINQQLLDIETRLNQLNDIIEIDELKLHQLDLSSSIRFNDRAIISSEAIASHSRQQNRSTLNEQGHVRSDPRTNNYRRHSTQATNLIENNHRPPSVRCHQYRQRSFQCICCKQMNTYYDNQENRCQTCKSPYKF